jgi:hypothetical protein
LGVLSIAKPITPDGTVPIIRADAAPYKVEPEDRGGMDVAHKDSTIFDAMRDGAQGRRIENLLADTADEQPIDRAVLFAGLKTDLADATTKSDRPSAQAEGPGNVKGSSDQVRGSQSTAGGVLARMGDYQSDRPMTEAERREQAAKRNENALKQPADPLPSVDAPILAAPTPTNNLPDEPAETAAEAAKPSKGFQEKPITKDSGPSGLPRGPQDGKGSSGQARGSKDTASVAVKTGVGNAYVQVASVSDAKLVKSEWSSVSSKLPMVKGLAYRVQTANLGAKGTYHRIQIGPMSGMTPPNFVPQSNLKNPVDVWW